MANMNIREAGFGSAKRGGKREGAGRPAGAKNKVPGDVKVALGAAFWNLGGIKYLEKVGKTNPTTFCALLHKLIPPEQPSPSGPVRHEVVLRWMTPEMAANRGLAPEAVGSAAAETVVSAASATTDPGDMTPRTETPGRG